MILSSVEQGIFAEIEAPNTNFRPGSKKLRVVLDTALELRLLGPPKQVYLDMFHPYIETPQDHRWGGTIRDEGRGANVSSAPAAIASAQECIDIARCLEHVALDMLRVFGAGETFGGVTLRLDDFTGQFQIFLECEDARLGGFALNLGLAMIHQALYAGKPDPRSRTILRLARRLRQTGHRRVDLREEADRFGVDGSVLHYSVKALNVFGFDAAPVALTGPPAPKDLGPILIVEDNELSRLLLHDALEDRGYATLAAADGRTALKMLCDYSASMVLLDVGLPDVNGITVAKWILESQPATTVVLMSGGMQTGDGDTFSNGDVRFIPKPFTMARLDGVIQTRHR